MSDDKTEAEIVPEPRGQGSGLFEDPHHTRGDAILIRKWKGVVDPEKVKPLIEKGYKLADDAAQESDARSYKGVMGVIHSFAKLEQEEAKAPQPTDSAVTVNIQNNDNRISVDDRRAEVTRIIAAALDRVRNGENSGATSSPENTEPTV